MGNKGTKADDAASTMESGGEAQSIMANATTTIIEFPAHSNPLDPDLTYFKYLGGIVIEQRNTYVMKPVVSRVPSNHQMSQIVLGSSSSKKKHIPRRLSERALRFLSGGVLKRSTKN
jgi:hypothetical protein